MSESAVEIINDKWLKFNRTKIETLYLDISQVEDITTNYSENGDQCHMTLIMCGGHQHQIYFQVPIKLKEKMTEGQQQELIENQVNAIINAIIEYK